MKTLDEIRQLGSVVRHDGLDAIKAFGDPLKGKGWGWGSASHSMPKPVNFNIPGQRQAGWVLKKTASIIELPFTFAVKATRWAVGGSLNAIKHHPRAALVLGGVAAAGAVGHAVEKRQQEVSALETQQKMAALQAGPSYMNSVSPQEAAAMEAQMRQAGQQDGQFAQKVQAAKSPEQAAAL